MVIRILDLIFEMAAILIAAIFVDNLIVLHHSMNELPIRRELAMLLQLNRFCTNDRKELLYRRFRANKIK